MTKKELVIVVAGDVTVDWLMYPVKPSDKGENWRLYQRWNADVLPGGAALLTDFIEQFLNQEGTSAIVKGPVLPKKEELRNFSPNYLIHSNVILNFYKQIDKNAEILRIKEFLGYIGPTDEKFPLWTPILNKDYEEILNKSNVDIVVLDDAGNRFRENGPKNGNLWPKALGSGEDLTIVYKMSLPLLEGSLWKTIYKRPSDNLIVIINAKDLRKTEGIHISKSLSWERTAKDLVFEIKRSSTLNSLNRCPYLIILFETDGAILYCGRNNTATLIFDPFFLEGAFESNIDGDMMGLTSIFTSTLVNQLRNDGISGLITGIINGLANERALFEIGYIKEGDVINYPAVNKINKKSTNYKYVCSSIELSTDIKNPDPDLWRILDHKTRHIRQLIAREIVLKGKAEGLDNVPIGKFGDYETIDRAEIESYSSIIELVKEFLSNQKPKNPLCFAVFGSPGTGKSSCVMQVLKSIDPNEDKLGKIFFNLSQFEDYQDLVDAFHKVRDISLSGKVPFVFFDEFDSDYKTQTLGWLKYFLAPMQDGKFKEGNAIHPIGNSIFVFAGGTRYTFKNFEQNFQENESTVSLVKSKDEIADNNLVQNLERKDPAEIFRNAKGPDFVSRLRGFINVMGPNRQCTEDYNDEAFIIRRAQVLRALFKEIQTASGIFNSSGRINIDEGILRAMLNVSNYKHGKRSMTALIEMSRLANKKRFDLSALPVKKQLEMHVDADEFLFLAQKERYQSMLLLRDLPDLRDLSNLKELSYVKREEAIVNFVAEAMNNYLNSKQNGGISIVSTEELKDAAADIPNKLWAIKCGIRKKEGTTSNILDFTEDEIKKLTLLEYDRRCSNIRFGASSYGIEVDSCNKDDLCSIPFTKLSNSQKRSIKEAVNAIPMILQDAGYEIYRMKDIGKIF
jgi:hypothetical protein